MSTEYTRLHFVVFTADFISWFKTHFDCSVCNPGMVHPCSFLLQRRPLQSQVGTRRTSLSSGPNANEHTGTQSRIGSEHPTLYQSILPRVEPSHPLNWKPHGNLHSGPKGGLFRSLLRKFSTFRQMGLEKFSEHGAVMWHTHDGRWNSTSDPWEMFSPRWKCKKSWMRIFESKEMRETGKWCEVHSSGMLWEFEQPLRISKG